MLKCCKNIQIMVRYKVMSVAEPVGSQILNNGNKSTPISLRNHPCCSGFRNLQDLQVFAPLQFSQDGQDFRQHLTNICQSLPVGQFRPWAFGNICEIQMLTND